MIVYRICQTYPPGHDPIDGMGSFRNGGGWNSKGTHAVYTASSLALARSELARHINLESIPDGFRVYEIEIPDEPYQIINPLPKGWNNDPPLPITQLLGDKYLRNTKIAGIKVSSVCDPNSFNYILNPLSIYFDQVKARRNYIFTP